MAIGVETIGHYNVTKLGENKYAVAVNNGNLGAYMTDKAGVEALKEKYNKSEDTVEIGVQVNGKVRGVVAIGVNEESDSALAKAKEVPGVKAAVEGKTIVKEMYVKGKIINIVVK